jgi:hypothetical protein
MKQSLVAFFASFAVAFLIHALLRQDCFYRHDGWGFFAAIEQGHGFASAHAFYLPMARLWCAMLAPLGVGSFVALGLFSAFGTAVAVAIHVLSLQRLGRKDWILSALWVGLCPAVLFFSTVVEVHGVFLAFASLSFYLCVRLVKKPGLLLSAAFGTSMALAAAVHASGALLPLLYLPWYGRRVRTARLAPILIGSTVVLAGGIAWLLPAIFLPGTGSATGSVLGSIQDLVAQKHRLGPVIWTEWLWPFFPTSLVLVLALAWQKCRIDAALLLVILLPYVLVCTLLLQEAPEIGAYILPWIFPASVFCLERIGPRWSRVLVLLAALLGIWGVASHESARGVDRAWAQAVAETSGSAPSYVLVWEDWEMDSLLLTSEQALVQPIYMRPYAAYDPETQRALLQVYGAKFSERETLLLSAATRSGLADPKGSLSGPMILEWLEKNPDLVLLDADGQRR